MLDKLKSFFASKYIFLLALILPAYIILNVYINYLGGGPYICNNATEYWECNFISYLASGYGPLIVMLALVAFIVPLVFLLAIFLLFNNKKGWGLFFISFFILIVLWLSIYMQDGISNGGF